MAFLLSNDAVGKLKRRGYLQRADPRRLRIQLIERRHAGSVCGDRRCLALPLGLVARLMFGYASVTRFRYSRRSPEVRSDLREFLARRTELDRQAAKHRLRLLAQSDFCPVARALDVPVFAITGAFDPTVPWIFVRRWLRRECPALREYKIIWHADHNVLGTAAETSADQVARWINQPQTNGTPDSAPTRP